MSFIQYLVRRALCPALAAFALSTAHADDSDNPTPSLEMGAEVYAKRCVLCHGQSGMGEGILPMKLKNYPNTNLMIEQKAKDRNQIKQVVIYGGYFSGFNEAMPPYGQELSWTEVESVADFVELMRENPEQAAAMIQSYRAEQLPALQLGKEAYDTRCVLCHGKYGEGDGRMAKILKDPPPFDLTASRVPEMYLREIIRLGGEAMGRSKHMPPWGDQLSDKEINALVTYLMTIRD